MPLDYVQSEKNTLKVTQDLSLGKPIFLLLLFINECRKMLHK